MKLLFLQYRLYFGRRLTWEVLNVCTLADEREDGVDRLPRKVCCARNEGALRQ